MQSTFNKVYKNGEGSNITMLAGIGKAIPLFFFLIAGLVLSLPLVIENEAVKKVLSFDLIAGFSAVMGVIGGAVFLLTKAKTILAVAPDSVTIHFVVMGKKFFEKSIPASQIEEVSFYQKKNEKLKHLQIAGDQGHIRIGQTLTDAEKE